MKIQSFAIFLKKFENKYAEDKKSSKLGTILISQVNIKMLLHIAYSI